MMVFISGGKKWKDEVKDIQYRTSQLKKYHNAVVIVRCTEYPDEMDTYIIGSMKREKARARAKTNNQIEEKDAEPIGMIG